MSFSVIVASFNSHGTLSRCLSSLVAQPLAAEIVVADCSPVNPADQFAGQFPRVRFLHFREPRTIPQLRWAAYAQTTGAVVAATEARCVPASDWCETLLRAHDAAPDAPAIGGPIRAQSGASAFELAVYFCEYGWHCPPADPVVRLASGANISYKRSALARCGDLIEAGVWETQLHQRWLDQGVPLRMASALVTFENSMNAGTVLRQRFHYGRGYAAERFRGGAVLGRLAHAALCPVLPALMSWRLARVAARRNRLAEYMRALPWVALFGAAWSCGELTGYSAGHAREQKVF